jgi:hypothetical protein
MKRHSCAWSFRNRLRSCEVGSMRPMGSSGSCKNANRARGVGGPSQSWHNNSNRGESPSIEEVAEQTEYEGLAWVEHPSEEVQLESELESGYV